MSVSYSNGDYTGTGVGSTGASLNRYTYPKRGYSTTMNDSGQERNNDLRPTEDVETLKLELELERLERQWLEEKAKLAPGYSHGTEPSAAGAIFYGYFFVVVGIVLIGGGLTIFKDDRPVAGNPAVVVGTLIVCLGGAARWFLDRKLRQYTEARQKYEDRRQQLLQDVAASREKANEGEGDN